MKNLREIEELLCVAMRALGDIPHFLKNIEELYTTENKRIIGGSIYDLGNIRKEIYKLDPTLEPQEMSLYENNETRYHELASLTAEAFNMEESGRYQEAKIKYETLLSKSKIPHFQHFAQAGLYRINEKIS